MTLYRISSAKRTLASYDDFIGRTGSDVIVCIDVGVLGVVRQLLKERGLWKSTYYTALDGNRYIIPTDEQFDLIDSRISAFLEETNDMATCNQFVNALEGVSQAIRDTACCAGSTAGGQLIDNEYYWGTEEPLSEPDTFGENEQFATEAEYLAFKCQSANAIMFGLIFTLRNISLIQLASLTLGASVTGAAVAFGLFNPPVALLLALLAVGGSLALVDAIADELQDNISDYVCGLYSATSAVGAYDYVNTELRSIALDVGFLEIQIGPIADVIMAMAPIDAFNQLFQFVGFPELPTTAVDCDTCDGCANIYLAEGVLTLDDDPDFTFEGVDSGSYEVVTIYFNYDGVLAEYCGTAPSVAITAAQNINVGGSYAYQIIDRAWGSIYTSQSPPPPTTFFDNVGRVYVRSLKPTDTPIVSISVQW